MEPQTLDIPGTCQGKENIFHFSDAAYDLDEGIKRLNLINDRILNHTLKPTLNAQFFALRGFNIDHEGLSAEGKILTICRAFGSRTTSIRSDEAICLMALFGLDGKKIAEIRNPSNEIEHLQRIRYFWEKIPKIPRAFIFY